MADITVYGYCTAPGQDFTAAWKGQFFDGESQALGFIAEYFPGRQRDSVVPKLLTVTSKDDRIRFTTDWEVQGDTPTFPAKDSAKDPTLTSVSQTVAAGNIGDTTFDVMWTLSVPTLQSATSKDALIELAFDIPVNAGTPSFPAKQSAKDPTLTGVATINTTTFDINWTLSVPSMTNLASKDASLVIDFDMPVNANTPTISAPESGIDPVISGTTQTTATRVTVNWTIPPQLATVTSIQSTDTGLIAIHDNPVNAGAPVIVPPESGADPILSGVTQVNPTTLKYDWTLTSAISLVSTTPSNGKVDLLFSVPIQISAQGQDPNNYTVTTVTPGAYVPNVTNITWVGSTLTVHVDGQTIGASYTLHMPMGAVLTFAGATWPFNSTTFTGADTAPFAVNAYPDGPYAFIVVFSEAVTEASATNPSNYAVVPGLTITTIDMVDTKTVRVHIAGAQSPGVVYTVTITGVIDKANNPT